MLHLFWFFFAFWNIEKGKLCKITFVRRECRGLSKILLHRAFDQVDFVQMHFMHEPSFLLWLIMSKIESERNPMNKKCRTFNCTGPAFALGCNLYLMQEIGWIFIFVLPHSQMSSILNHCLIFWCYFFVYLWIIWPFCESHESHIGWWQH